MDFRVEQREDTAKEAAWRAQCREFVEREIIPNMAEWESRDELALDCYRRMAEFGYFAMSYPKHLGGTELPANMRAIAMEELNRAGAGPGGYLHAIPMLYGRLFDDGVPEHLEMLKSMLRGEHLVAFCETEPGGGSDAAAIWTTAVRDGDEWVINGDKTFLSLVPGADWLIVTALTDPAAGGKRGMSLFLVPDDTPGVEIWEIPTPEVKAWHTFGSMRLTNVRVPASALLGEENQGFYLIKGKVWAKRGVGRSRAEAVGLKEPGFQRLVTAMTERTFAGEPMLRQPWVQQRLIETLCLSEMQRLNGLKGEWLARRGDRTTAFASMAMLFGKVIGRRMLLTRMELLAEEAVHGRSELMKDFIAATGSRAAGGGVDVHRIIVGQELYGPEWAVHKD
jgi:alkylation response protein AidB-like acyl-CoA dehydrogenase